MAFRVVLAAHLLCAFGATALFWVPLFADKGGPLHIRAGLFYARLIYLTAATGAPLALLLFLQASEPGARRTALFLTYLMIILVMPVFHGIRAIRAQRTGTPVASALHAALSGLAIAAGLVLGAFAIQWQEWPYLLVSPIGPVMGVRALLYARNPLRAREEHIVSMLVSGIAVHTAMLVFGSTRTLGMQLTGMSVYVPWLLPVVVGLPLLLWRVRRERAASGLR